jgi:AbrB family looped-hinge helix DNA binding protein
MISVRISDKGQITLPAKARRKLGLRPGAKLEVIVKEEGIDLRPLKTIMDVAGIFHDAAKGKSTDWDAIREEATKRVAEEIIHEDER